MYKKCRYSNICMENDSYRVRVMRKGVKFSKSFKKLKEAISYRNSTTNA